MNTHYTALAKSLHWLMALMIFGLLAYFCQFVQIA